LGLDPKLVVERDGKLSATINGCEIAAAAGRIEDFPATVQTVVVLPCNEYFDDQCAYDTRSALGAYVNKVFPGKTDDFISLVKGECAKNLGTGTERQKRERERAISFGPGRALLIQNALGSDVPIAIVSTTTQRAGQGLVAKSSFLFEGMYELVTRLVDERLNQVVMPILGAGHGGMDPATAFVSLVLALAEAIRYVPGPQRSPQNRPMAVTPKPANENAIRTSHICTLARAISARVNFESMVTGSGAEPRQRVEFLPGPERG